MTTKPYLTSHAVASTKLQKRNRYWWQFVSHKQPVWRKLLWESLGLPAQTRKGSEAYKKSSSNPVYFFFCGNGGVFVSVCGGASGGPGQPFSFARKLCGVTIKFHSDFADSCNPWTHEANMTPNLLFLTSWDILSQRPVKYMNKPSLMLQFQNCRSSTLLFSDLGLGCNRLNRLNMIEFGSTELICRCCDNGCFLSSNLHIVFWGLQAYPCFSTHFDFSIDLLI